MRWAFVGLVLAASLAGAALAQDEQLTTDRFQWERAPNIREAFVRYVPPRAINDQVSGAALVCCTVNRRRQLDCEIAAESQPDYGFGNATVRFMRLYTMSEASYAEWQADPKPIARAMRWYVGDPTPETFARLAAIGETWRGLCSALDEAEAETE